MRGDKAAEARTCAMKTRFHFLSGLPRSGSTLLAALLAQDPGVRAGMSSPVCGLVGRLQDGMGPRSEHAAQIDDRRRRAVLRAVVEGYHADVPAGTTVVDTNRGWCAKLPLIDALFPDSTVVACVRDPAWILDSFERVLRLSPLAPSKLFKAGEGLTARSRVDALAAPGGVLGFAWEATREAFYGASAARLIVVDYEALCRDPARAMEALRGRLGLAPFPHDFEAVHFDGGDAFDAELGVPGLHAVRPRVGFEERATVLPPDLFARFAGRSYWRNRAENPRGVEVLLP